jgi:thymidylate synthase (FAD)
VEEGNLNHMTKFVSSSKVEELPVPPLGDDLFVANVARVSFNKWKDTFDGSDIKGSDARLIKYLAEHGHWTPFGHPHLSLRIETPIFVSRQLFKHQIGFVINEVSRRYVDEEPEFYLPSKNDWRRRPENKKQGSGDAFEWEESSVYALEPPNYSQKALKTVCATAVKHYNHMLKLGITPEQARMILPQNMMTKFIWTGSLAAWARVVNLRVQPDAQKETGRVGAAIAEVLHKWCPISAKYLLKCDQVKLEEFLREIHTN